MNFQEVPVWKRKFPNGTLRVVTCHPCTRRAAPHPRRALLILPRDGLLAAGSPYAPHSATRSET